MSIKPDDGLLYSAPHILSMTYFVPVYLVHRIEAAGCIPPPVRPGKCITQYGSQLKDMIIQLHINNLVLFKLSVSLLLSLLAFKEQKRYREIPPNRIILKTKFNKLFITPCNVPST